MKLKYIKEKNINDSFKEGALTSNLKTFYCVEE